MRLEVGVAIRLEHEVDEGLGIKESRNRLAGIGTLAFLLGIHWDGDLFPDLRAHFKVFANLCQIPEKLIRCGWSVKAGIHADSPEERLAFIEILAKLAKAFSWKGGRRMFATIGVALPAFIRPRQSAERTRSGMVAVAGAAGGSNGNSSSSMS